MQYNMRAAIKDMFSKAYGKYALGAFNVFNAEQVLALFQGASTCNRPLIVQITPVAQKYLHSEMLEYCIQASEKLYPNIDFTVHLDHGDYESCEKAIDSAYYNSVMIDASHEKFEENIRITSEIVKMAHAKNIAVEAELGVLSGVEDNISISEKDALYTDPKQAKEFVERTKCDSLAIAIGTSHGAYKFNNNSKLRLDVLSEINQNLPGYPLVLHGASAVPKVEIDRINHAGGRLNKSAKGTQLPELHKAIKLGVCKINIATDMRLLWTRVHREFFLLFPEKFDMIIPGEEYMETLQKFVSDKCLDLIVENK